MKKLIFHFSFFIFSLIAWAWRSLKEWCDPVTVDILSRNGKVMKFHETSRSIGFHLFDPKYSISRA